MVDIQWLNDERLIQACHNNNLDDVKLCISKGANVNYHDIYSDTALIISSWRGMIDIVIFLLENEADINARILDINGRQINSTIIKKGNSYHSFDMSSAPGGVYLIILNNQNQIANFKFVSI